MCARMPFMPKFLVKDTYVLESQRLIVLAGAIVEGSISAGMTVSVPLESSLSLSARIHNIGFARYPDRQEDVCLCIAYEHPEEAASWIGLGIRDETLDVSI